MPSSILNRLPLVLAVGLIVVSGTLMFYSSAGDAPVMDELAHIPAGYSYVRFLDSRLNPEHPPLLKALSGMPLLGQNFVFPTESSHWTDGVNDQWEMGRAFLYGSGNDPERIVNLARLAPIFLTLLLILLIFIFASELLGPWWALMPTFLFALSPTVLAHGHYVTTDIAATFGIVLATFLFLKQLLHPSPKHLVWAGVAFGIAQLLKFSLFLLVPFFLLMVGIFWFSDALRDAGPARIRRALKNLWVQFSRLALVFVIGFVLVYIVYAVLTLHEPAEKQIADTNTIVNSFVTPAFFPPILDTLVRTPVTRPLAQYILGLSMVFSRAAGGNTGYFLGTVTNLGWWYYFPLVFLMKEPLPSLLLILGGIFLGAAALIRWLRERGRYRALLDYLGTHFPECTLFMFIALYWFLSIRSPLNIGVRHILPTLPLIYILVAGGIKSWVLGNTRSLRGIEDGFSVWARLTTGFKAILRTSLSFLVIIALLLWYAGESVSAAPYFLSYFNEAVGGTSQGYRYANDSNYDWGQDLYRLATWTGTMREDPRNEMDKMAVNYFGAGEPSHSLGKDFVENWWPSRGNPADIGIHWLAVSVGILEGGLGETVRGWVRSNDDSYAWLANIRASEPGMGGVPKPDYRIGTSIFVYRLTPTATTTP